MNYEGLSNRELWELLFQKTENEMAAYMNSLNQLPRAELIMAADEISAMSTCRAELMALGEDLSREKMLFLLRQEKPLELLSEAWMERRTVDEGELFQSLLIEVYPNTGTGAARFTGAGNVKSNTLPGEPCQLAWLSLLHPRLI